MSRFTPLACSISATSCMSEKSTPPDTFIECPVRTAASCSLGDSQVTQESSWSESSAAGAGFSITGTPASLAHFAVVSTISMGSSSCIMTAS